MEYLNWFAEHYVITIVLAYVICDGLGKIGSTRIENNYASDDSANQ